MRMHLADGCEFAVKVGRYSDKRSTVLKNQIIKIKDAGSTMVFA